MSGGSFNYLCDDDELPEETVERMAEYLREHKVEAAAEMTDRVLFHLRQAKALASTLRAVWHAAEWYASGDHGEETFREEVERWADDNLVEE